MHPLRTGTLKLSANHPYQRDNASTNPLLSMESKSSQGRKVQICSNDYPCNNRRCMILCTETNKSRSLSTQKSCRSTNLLSRALWKRYWAILLATARFNAKLSVCEIDLFPPVTATSKKPADHNWNDQLFSMIQTFNSQLLICSPANRRGQHQLPTAHSTPTVSAQETLSQPSQHWQSRSLWSSAQPAIQLPILILSV